MTMAPINYQSDKHFCQYVNCNLREKNPSIHSLRRRYKIFPKFTQWGPNRLGES
ncbi:hypothetical protein ARMGADRAFT_191405 [Armillaria gallica]|uniref:Uncharacterized protein n=1 Tax=Armillaria gallica TaxID=47427 RepID=A0A2H3D9I0_ARMGA|nr:hypothetical protein ARMGADRAFT_191405 [Armillaria gallica]